MIRRLSLGALILLLVGLAGYSYHDQQRMAARADREHSAAVEDRRLAAQDRAELKAQVSKLREQLRDAGIEPSVPEPAPEPPPTAVRPSPRSMPTTTRRAVPPATAPPRSAQPPSATTTTTQPERPPPPSCSLPLPVVGCVP